MFLPYCLLRPFIFSLEPEKAHELAIKALILQGKIGSLLSVSPVPESSLEVMGLTFPNPVGLAAGFDKNAVALDGLAQFGFGFLEVGTVTPLPQSGNPLPRIFRLEEAQALLNRLGFNNQGIEAMMHSICQAQYDGILGINVGKNANTPLEKAHEDYIKGLERLYSLASYFVLNISSPNTQNLRSLHEGEALDYLLLSVTKARNSLSDLHGKKVPIVLKVSPDLNEADLQEIVGKIRKYQLDGLIATNTTVSRDAIQGHPLVGEKGGLSGKPLMHRSTEILYAFSRIIDGEIPIIASGGILSASDAAEKIKAGASLVQLYTGLIYKGPGLVKDSVQAISSIRA